MGFSFPLVSSYPFPLESTLFLDTVGSRQDWGREGHNTAQVGS